MTDLVPAFFRPDRHLLWGRALLAEVEELEREGHLEQQDGVLVLRTKPTVGSPSDLAITRLRAKGILKSFSE